MFSAVIRVSPAVICSKKPYLFRIREPYIGGNGLLVIGLGFELDGLLEIHPEKIKLLVAFCNFYVQINESLRNIISILHMELSAGHLLGQEHEPQS